MEKTRQIRTENWTKKGDKQLNKLFVSGQLPRETARERERERRGRETGVTTAADYNDLSDRAIISTIIPRNCRRGNGKPTHQHFPLESSRGQQHAACK